MPAITSTLLRARSSKSLAVTLRTSVNTSPLPILSSEPTPSQDGRDCTSTSSSPKGSTSLVWMSRITSYRTCSVSLSDSLALSLRRVEPELTSFFVPLKKEHIAQNHDLTVRFRWQAGSLAIWDNVRPTHSPPYSRLGDEADLSPSIVISLSLKSQRSTLHSATNDYGSATREGDRVVSVGERPYYDPNSVSREAALRGKEE